tara:strand:+ start:785 stop:1084 length:300 start_codon:yes stop_codon:yes gene_type:complete
MTQEQWIKWADDIEARIKRLFTMAISLAGALAITVASLLAAWHQVLDAKNGIELNSKAIIDQEVHLAVADDRIDKTPEAPPPDPSVAAEARAAATPTNP